VRGFRRAGWQVEYELVSLPLYLVERTADLVFAADAGG
jgi:hypothetical protein